MRLNPNSEIEKPVLVVVLDLWTRVGTKTDFPAINLFARCHGGIQLLENETRTSPLTWEFRLNSPKWVIGTGQISEAADKWLR
jgi:hypothetical protein